jgi:hypothetical protein
MTKQYRLWLGRGGMVMAIMGFGLNITGRLIEDADLSDSLRTAGLAIFLTGLVFAAVFARKSKKPVGLNPIERSRSAEDV